MNRQQMTLAVELATSHDISFEEALAHLEFHPDPYERFRYEATGRGGPVRYERVQMPSKDFSANPMTNAGDYQGERLEPGRAAGPYQSKPDAEVEAAPDVDMMIGDPHLGQAPNGDQGGGPRVRFFVDKQSIGDVVVTPDGVKIDAEGDGAAMIRRLLDANAVTDVEALKQLPSKLGKRTPGGLRAVWIEGGQADESGPADTMDDSDTDSDVDASGFNGFDEADDSPELTEGGRGPMFEEDDEEDEQPVRMARRYLRDGDRLIYTKPIW